jgi:hypothetical protein
MDGLKSAFKSKTMWFALALALFGVVETQIHLFAQYMTPEAFGLFNILVGVAVAVLRVITTVPLNQK